MILQFDVRIFFRKGWNHQLVIMHWEEMAPFQKTATTKTIMIIHVGVSKNKGTQKMDCL